MEEETIRARDVARRVVPVVLAVVVFALGTHAAVWLGLWPGPRPSLDVDRTLLIHQIEASRQSQSAQVLVLGDSSCLMDVNADELAWRLGVEVLNLGTVSYLDLDAAAWLARSFVESNPAQLRLVLVLMHPESLRRPGPDPYYVRMFESMMQGTNLGPAVGFRGVLLWGLGLDTFRERLLCRWVPTSFSGVYGQYYGFTTTFDRFLQRHRGSAIEPDRQPFQGSPEYRLARTWEAPSRRFRGEFASGARVFAGITPVPASFAAGNYGQVQEAMLLEWGDWLDADRVLTNLPAVWPDRFFGKTTHLNDEGAMVYTKLLAEILGDAGWGWGERERERRGRQKE